MRWALAALLLSCSALADPSATLLPHDAVPSAIEWAPQSKWVAVGIASGAVVTALLTVLAVVLAASNQGFPRPVDAGCSAARPCP